MPLLPDIGDTFSGCEILARCGSGAYGIAYLARNPLNSKVIIKIVGNLGSGERELAGLRNYMKIAGKHPALLQIYHIGEHDGGFYYTMEAADNISGDPDSYVPATLGNLFRQKKIFSPEEAVEITRELAAGLQIMHEAGLIHRDIKPDNIIFINGKPKLSDPGLVISVGEAASFAGTPGFIPPELLSGGGSIDQSADIYALGKVFYCLVTGKPAGAYPQLPQSMRLDICRQIYPALVKLCNRKAEKRCKNVGELLETLPARFKNPTWLERCCEDFRSWKVLNERTYKICRNCVLGGAILLLAAAGGVTLKHVQQQHFQEKVLHSLNEFKKINHDRKNLELLQLSVYLPEKASEYQRLNAELAAAEKQSDFRLIVQKQQELAAFSAAAAEKMIPVLPENIDSTASGAAAAGSMYGFLAAPFAEYLLPERKNALKAQLQDFKNKVYREWSGLRCGEDLENVQYYYIPLKFLPPGAVVMPHNGKTVKIPYHFWIGKNEVPCSEITARLNISPQFSPGVSNPAERVAWNDILLYCRVMTELMTQHNLLPENYIVRPLTEAEWQYAADNGWLGKDTVPLEERANIAVNSQKRTWPAGRMKPNKLGINDIYGNVAEIVQPIEPPDMQQSVIVRGGSFSDSKEKCDRRIEYLKYQNIPYNIGFRIAVAPGTRDYFDREFFLGGAVQAVVRNKVYELIGVNYGVFDWHTAKDLCSLLGGRLAEIDDSKHITELRSALPLLGKWETLLGATRINGEWFWEYSKRKLDFGKWRKYKRREKDKHLTLIGNDWDRTSIRKLGILLCQWDEKTYPNRNNHLADGKKLPFELCRFDYKDKRYVLFNLSCHWLTAKRICELLGGSLAILDRKDVREYVMQKLSGYKNHHIYLGGYRRGEAWYWLNGSAAETPTGVNLKHFMPTVNMNYISLHNNRFFDSQDCFIFLCEWRISSDSSR